jgi:hypothetical protein
MANRDRSLLVVVVAGGIELLVMLVAEDVGRYHPSDVLRPQ